MEIIMQDKLRLIEFFEFLLDEEISKPLGQMNSKAVDNYIDILLDLQDKHVELSTKYIDEQVRKIFHPEEFAVPEAVKTTKKYFNKKKVWLVAACIAILVALFSIISVANDWNVFDFLSEKFGSVHSVPLEEEQNFNGVSVFMNGKNTNYSNIQEALKSEKINILYPTLLPYDIEITNITSFSEGPQKIMTYSFNNPDMSITVFFNKHLSDKTKKYSTKIQEINSITCYICEMDDIKSTQIEFEYNGNTYSFNYTQKDVLIEMIKNLEEIKNEN